MPYQPPDKNSLNDHFHHLLKDYETADAYPTDHRRALIYLITSFKEQLGKEYNHHAAIGICVYALKKISAEYRFFSPHKSKNFGGFFGASLYELLEKCLDTGAYNPSNPLTDQKTFFYLSALYLSIENAQQNRQESAEKKDVLQLKKELEGMITPIVVNLMKKRPTYESLVKNFANIPAKCGVKNDGNFVKLIRDMNEDLIKLYPPDTKDHFHISQSYGIRYGALVYVITQLNPGWIWYGSELYYESVRVANIKNANELSLPIKKISYSYFFNYILLQSAQRKNADLFFRNILIELAGEIVEMIKLEDGRGRSYFEIIAGHAAAYGATLVLSKLIASVSLGAFGFLSAINPEYALFITLAAYALKSSVTKQIADSIHSFIEKMVAEPFVLTFKILQQMIDSIKGIFVSEDLEKNIELFHDPDFIQILEKMPPHLLAKEQRLVMKYLVGLDAEKIEAKEAKNEKFKVLVQA